MKSPDCKTETYTLSLYPHRSLSARGFLVLMLFIGGVSFTIGAVFLTMGAWPILGFLDLDVLLVYMAFRANFREGRRREIIQITDGNLCIRAISPRGNENTRTFQAYWSRCGIEGEKLLIRCRNDVAEIGFFLILDEKEEVVKEITSALYKAPNSPPLY